MHAGRWNGLGGKLIPGETPEECAIREVKEESGYLINSPVLKGIITFANSLDGSPWYCFVFICDYFSGEITGCEEGELAWIPDKDLMGLPLNEADYLFMPWLGRKKFFSAKFIYEGKKLKGQSVNFY